MKNRTKFKLLIIVVVLHFFAVYLDLGVYWTSATPEETELSAVDLTELYCRRSSRIKVTNACDSTWTVFKNLSENCGLPSVNLSSTAEQFPGENEPVVSISEFPEEESPKVDLSREQEKPVRQEKNLVYHILFVLLVTSVTASIVDFFQEKSRRKAIENYNNSTTPTSGSRNEAPLNRRISLAELTMQRHARRESQAGYKPPGSPDRTQPAATARRNSSVNHQDGGRSSGNGSAGAAMSSKFRQKSWPSALLRRWTRSDRVDSVNHQSLLDGGWAERRRVRMIQRH